MPIGIRDLVRLSVYIVSMQVNMHEAKTHFSRLVERALAGEEVVIARDGVPLVTLEPIRRVGQPRTPGLSRGRGRVADDFDAPLDEETLREFE
jgi:antitoxin (DNA-binding transcriptional repressor) of toxin-antitoxin stability system